MTPLSKRLIIALVVSVAVNLLFCGIAVGTAVHRSRMRAEHAHLLEQGRGPGGRDGRPHGDGPRGEFAPRGEFGPRDRAARRAPPFGGLLAGHLDELAARRKATMAARSAVRDALTHEPFDAAALDHSLSALRTETATTQELLHKTILETARTGDADVRAKLAKGFERMGGVGAL